MLARSAKSPELHPRRWQRAQPRTGPLLSRHGVAASEARRTAFDLLLRVERDGAFADELLHSRRTAEINVRQRAFVTEAVLGCLRHQRVSRKTGKPTHSLDPEVRIAVRLGARQLRCMSGVADHAAVSESVEQVRWARKRSAAGLVNAVLSRQPPSPSSEQAARLCHPNWRVTRWQAAFGNDPCNALLRANLMQSSTHFRMPPLGHTGAEPRAKVASAAGRYRIPSSPAGPHPRQCDERADALSPSGLRHLVAGARGERVCRRSRDRRPIRMEGKQSPLDSTGHRPGG